MKFSHKYTWIKIIDKSKSRIFSFFGEISILKFSFSGGESKDSIIRKEERTHLSPS